MHFEIFAVMAVTTIYRDWRVVASSVVVVAVHHVGFYFLQVAQLPVYIVEQNYLSYNILFIHSFFAVAEGAILGMMAVQAYSDGASSNELTNTIHSIMEEEGKFNLDVTTSESTKALQQFSYLITAFANVINQTKDVSSNICSITNEVEALSTGVKQASLDTSGRVSTIASATEEMTVNNESVAERASTVNELTEEAMVSSKDAKNIVENANSEVLSLQQDLSQTSGVITNLAEKCFQIESVMSSIKAISEQTNLLALNAAIESARAGEHGRGFAVVADEVRQLAMRTKENTIQISDITALLINDSKQSVDNMQSCVSKSEKVSDGSNLAKEVIEKVVANITSVSENMSSVSSAIKEQSLASNDIAKSSNILADTSQGLAVNADASQVSVSQLKDEIVKLEKQLTQFC